MTAPGEPIAIVGAACRLPGAPDVARFWDLLREGRDAVTEVPEGRWSKSFFFHPNAPKTPARSYTWAAGTLGDVAGFDAGFFGISPREAEQIDPQQRLLLELTWEALEDAGLAASRLAGADAGVYIGASAMDYGSSKTGDPAAGNAYLMTGTSLGIIANRISYQFDLRGPSLVVDTACSSSLVALDLACKALAAGQIGMAIVGGVNLLLSPFAYLGFSAAQMLSRRGRCFAFDDRADGYVRGEGGGIMILKPLAAALAAGDPIRGLILGTGTNQDGRTVGLSLPNGAAQASLLEAVYGAAGVAPTALSFIEAHGTGTPVGDPIEAGALGAALGQHRAVPLPIGSVKSNLGHLEPASGMAGLIKTMLALEHRVLPRSLNFVTPNPNIAFDALNLRVADTALDLPAEGRLIAGVNSFGFGGTNGHAILASPPALAAPAAPAEEGAPPPLLLSARSEAALTQMARDWADLLDARSEPAAAGPLLRGLARLRDRHRHRLVLEAPSVAALSAQLRQWADPATRQAAAPLAEGQAVVGAEGRLVFVFSGNGAQWAGMARDALAMNATFAAAAVAIDAALAPLLGWSPLARLREDPPVSLARTDISQPLLFVVQAASVAALKQRGIEPAVCVGHSVGEIAAAWAAGALTLGDAAKIVVERSHQQERTRGTGRLAALGMPAADAAPLLARIGGLEIAAINSHGAITVAGQLASLQRLKAAAATAECYFQLLDLDYPFHSAAMDPIRDDLIAALRPIRPVACGARFISTVTGGPLSGEALDADYWWRNIREPVRFAEAIDHLIANEARVFVEIGPNPILLSYLRNQLRAREVEGRIIGTLTRQPAPRDPFARVAADCFAAGCDVSGAPDFAGPVAIRGLPRYPWQRTRHWFTPTSERLLVMEPIADHPMLGFRREPEQWRWTNLIDTAARPWLADHAVEQQPVLPAAAFVEIAAAAAVARFGAVPTVEIVNLEIVRALPLDSENLRALRVELGADNGITIASRARLGEEAWLPHAAGRVAIPGTPPRLEWPALTPDRILDGDEVYATAERLGLSYGPVFRGIASVELTTSEARVVFHEGAAPEAGWLIDPTRLDGAMQGFLTLLVARGAERAGESYLPFRFGRVRLFAPFGRAPATARLRLDHDGVRTASADFALFDAAGETLVEATDCWFRRLKLRHPIDPAEDAFHTVLAATRAPEQPGHPPAGEPGAETGLVTWIAAGDAVATEPGDEAGLLLEGFLEAAAAETSTDTPAAPRDTDLPPAAEIWRTVLAESPDLVAELALAAAAIQPHPPAPAPDLVEQMLYASPTAQRAMSVLAASVASFAARWPAARPLRVLEIGARGGALTRRLLRLLADRVDTLHYLATDPDPDQRARLDAATANRPGARAQGWPLAAAGEDGFDLIVSLHGLTRCGDGAEALAALSCAATGATLLCVEPLPNPLWDAIFGRDGAGAAAYAARHGAGDWQARLRVAGFRETRVGRPLIAAWPAQLIAALGPPAPERAAPEEAGRFAILIAATADSVAQRLARRLEAAGIATRLIDPPHAADGAQLLGALSQTHTVEPEIIVLPTHTNPRRAGTDAVADRLTNILTVVRLVTGARDKARLTLVTRDACQPVPATTQTAATGAAIWALGRVIANEVNRLQCRLVDFPGALRADALVDRLAGEILAPDGEQEIVWTRQGRRAVRLRRGLPRNAAVAGQIRLGAMRPGLLDSLAWQPAAEGAPAAGEVAIAVRAAGVNFRDVMWALDLLPEEALKDGFAGAGFGLECAGIVTAVGPGVEGLAVGDRVAAFAPHALASRVVTAAAAAVPLPAGMDFATAASLPVVYLTAAYALGTLARLEPGETVLIHGGAGGVGIAAIHYARHRGARIIATAGSETKRAFLRLLGVDHVLDSRGMSFADGVMALTGGAGVDVVLNSLGGEAMERSLGLLKPFGRFLELGKRDFYLDTRVGLRPLRQNISYFAVDADQLPLRRPALARRLLGEIMTLVREGALQPLPRRVFPFTEAAEAFRLMQGAGHIGKIVLCPDAPAAPATGPAPRDFVVRADRTYLVTGGLTGFGLATAQWLTKRGARHLALLGRRGGATPGAAEALAQFATAGVAARAYAADVTDAAALTAVLARLRADQPPLGGIVHAAMVLDDALLGDLDVRRIAAVLAPKLTGADHLDRLTRDDPLDWFLLYSSATTMLGAPGQGSYVAANAALEGLARRRNADGRPTLAVAWGPIADAGVLAVKEDAREALSRRLAATPMAAAQALDALPALWASGLDTVALARVNWRGARRYMPILASPSFSDFAAAMADSGGGDLREELDGLAPAAAKERVASLLVEEIGRILQLAPEKIDRARPLSALGMDSLMAVELRMALETRLGIDLPLLSLSEGTTIAAVALLVVRALGIAGGDTATQSTFARYETDDDMVLAMAAADGARPGAA